MLLVGHSQVRADRSAPPPPSTTATSTGATSAGFPGPSNTGVPAGTDLTPSSSLIIRVPGEEVHDLSVVGSIRVLANDVHITRVKVTSFAPQAIQIARGVTGVIITDSTIIGTGGGACAVGIAASGFTALRVDVSGCQDGIHPNGNATVQDSYIHDLALTPTSHNDCIQVTQGSNIVIRHHTLVNPHRKNSTIHVKGDTDDITGVTIASNYLDGGSHTLQLEDGAHRLTDVHVSGNLVGSDYIYGWLLLGTSQPVAWSDNLWAAPRAPVPTTPHRHPVGGA
jgi:hypothetical protein